MIKEFLKEFCRSPKNYIKKFIFFSRVGSIVDRYNTKRILNKKPDILIYFSGETTQTDSILQWKEYFKILSKQYSVVILVRDKSILRFLSKKLSFIVHFVKNLNELLLLYEITKPKIIFYTNNDYKNFQSLIYNNAMHIYLNNKNESYTNQIKGYDFIIVQDKNEIYRYMKRVIKIQKDIFIVMKYSKKEILGKVGNIIEKRNIELKNRDNIDVV